MINGGKGAVGGDGDIVTDCDTVAAVEYATGIDRGSGTDDNITGSTSRFEFDEGIGDNFAFSSHRNVCKSSPTSF